MTSDLLNIFSVFKEHFGFEIYLDSKWASTYSNHRGLIRKQLYKKTKNKSVFDLEKFPNIEPKFVSISHSPIMGGFVIADQNVGFDLEQFQRLSLGVIKRISKEEELKLFAEDQVKAIWSIKESVYKCARELDSNIPSVQILANKALSLKCNDEGLFLKTKCFFKDKTFETISFISQNSDLCLSVSYNHSLS